jgi:transcriptional regulator with XRE-family HTH domain
MTSSCSRLAPPGAQPNWSSPTERIEDDGKERGYSQEGFAAHAGLDRSYYGAIERGVFNVTVETVLRVAAGLGVPAWKILRRADL